MKGVLFLAVLIGVAAPSLAQPSATEAVRTAAAAGDADAQFALAQAYQTGRGVSPDPDMAVTWYRRAAIQGHARASDELGFLLFSRGDRRAAIPYVEKAAARGDARAFYLLGTAHFNGDLVSRDWPLAYAQTARAAEAGLSAAKQNLEMMERYLLPADRAKADMVLATLPPVRKVGAVAAVVPPTPRAVAVPVETAKAAPTPRQARATGAWRVQLGAFGSQERAEAGLARLTAKVPALGRLDRKVVAAGAVRRLTASGLASKSDAESLCRDVRAAKGDCLVLAPER